MSGRKNHLGELLWDNPILIKHVRARLRRGTLLGSASIVGALGLLIIWHGILTGGFRTGTSFGLISVLQFIVLSVIGASQIGSSVGKARESNILDFHRISPLSPLVVTLGFFFGAPILEYVLFAGLLPLSAGIALHQDSPIRFVTFLKVFAGLLLFAWAFHGLALLSALMMKKPKANPGAAIFAAVFMIFFFSSGGLFGLVLRVEEDQGVNFFNLPIPWVGFQAIYFGAALIFLMIASIRKMRSERMHAFSKPQALAFVTTVGVLLLGACWGYPDQAWLVIFVLYALIVAGIVATVAMTPAASDYAKGLHRAERSGRLHLPPWDDLALNRIGVAGISLIVLVVATIASNALTTSNGLDGETQQGSFGLAIAIGVLVMAYFGLACQYFFLMSTRHGGTLMALFLFFAWIVPLLAGLICMAASLGEGVDIGVLALSPIPGLALAAGGAPSAHVQTAKIAALLPAIVLFFLFNNLVTSRRRRVEREVQRIGPGKPLAQHPTQPDPLVLA